MPTRPMTEAIRAMQDPQRSADYRVKGAERAKHYSATAAKDRYWAVIRDVLDKAAPKARSPGKRKTL